MQAQDLSRIIEMAWEDRTPFEAIQQLYGLNESAVIRLMRQQLNPNSFKLWRKRMSGRKTKHLALRGFEFSRAYCPQQYKYQ
ncbi:MAG: TIGR03643 family protein [Moraxellaceae bacterium]|nr:TIGR03643 family protein [Pseudomonadales bacterium]MCP5173691.1 TIGR03643 family protein [Moraxellaceae bacterium]HQV23574.1 TIGR03643 family protein [Agitococcus sp.]